MMSIPGGAQLLSLGGLLGKAAVLGRFAAAGLFRAYPVTTACLVFSGFRSLLLLYFAETRSRLFGLSGYSIFYAVSQPVLWAFYFLVVLELYSRAVERYSGLQRMGRVVMYSSLAAVAGPCALLILFDQRAGVDPYPFISYLLLQERSIFVALAGICLLLTLFLCHYRLAVRRNVVVLLACFGGYFLTSALLLTLRWHFGPDFSPIRRFSNAGFYYAALAGMAVFVNRAGEAETWSLVLPWNAKNRELETALALQLQSFNRTLLKVLKT